MIKFAITFLLSSLVCTSPLLTIEYALQYDCNKAHVTTLRLYFDWVLRHTWPQRGGLKATQCTYNTRHTLLHAVPYIALKKILRSGSYSTQPHSANPQHTYVTNDDFFSVHSSPDVDSRGVQELHGVPNSYIVFLGV